MLIAVAPLQGDPAPDLDKQVLLAERFGISLDEMVLGKVPVSTKPDELGAKGMTRENQQRARKGQKIFGMIAATVLAIDAIAMLVHFLVAIICSKILEQKSSENMQNSGKQQNK